MAAWSPEQWIQFFTGLGGFIGVCATIYLQIRNNAKSKDNGEKLSAVVSQTREIARAVPDASTAPTDSIINKGA